MGKLIEMDFEAENDDDANKEIKKLSSKFLANEVIEDYEFKVWSIDEVTK